MSLSQIKNLSKMKPMGSDFSHEVWRRQCITSMMEQRVYNIAEGKEVAGCYDPAATDILKAWRYSVPATLEKFDRESATLRVKQEMALTEPDDDARSKLTRECAARLSVLNEMKLENQLRDFNDRNQSLCVALLSAV